MIFAHQGCWTQTPSCVQLYWLWFSLNSLTTSGISYPHSQSPAILIVMWWYTLTWQRGKERTIRKNVSVLVTYSEKHPGKTILSKKGGNGITKEREVGIRKSHASGGFCSCDSPLILKQNESGSLIEPIKQRSLVTPPEHLALTQASSFYMVFFLLGQRPH